MYQFGSNLTGFTEGGVLTGCQVAALVKSKVNSSRYELEGGIYQNAGKLSDEGVWDEDARGSELIRILKDDKVSISGLVGTGITILESAFEDTTGVKIYVPVTPVPYTFQMIPNTYYYGGAYVDGASYMRYIVEVPKNTEGLDIDAIKNINEVNIERIILILSILKENFIPRASSKSISKIKR